MDQCHGIYDIFQSLYYYILLYSNGNCVGEIFVKIEYIGLATGKLCVFGKFYNHFLYTVKNAD